MKLSGMIALLASTGAVALASTAAAIAAGGVAPARGSTRSSLVHAFVVQDGGRAGINGEYVTRSGPLTGVVCQKTPDAGVVRFLFRRSGRSWRFLFATHSTSRGSSTEQRLERACH